MYKEGKILFLVAETSIHPGAGSEVGIVDLPIQREAHTEFPIIRGSSLKGALRDYFYTVKDNGMEIDNIDDLKNKVANGSEKNLLKVVFGPDADEGGAGEENNAFSSAISITDARILFFPVKSLKKVFAYITCPMVLKRFRDDLRKIKKDDKEDQVVKVLSDFIKQIENKLEKDDIEAVVFSTELVEKINDSDNEKYVVLEEYSFKAEELKENNNGKFPEVFKNIFEEGDFRKDKLEKHLVILSDDDFKDFVLHSTEIVPRIRISKETGTVASGNLWYEENIPTDTIFYSLVLFSDAKKKVKGKGKDKDNENEVLLKAGELLKLFEKNLPPIFQLGGNETVGRGLISTAIYPNKKDKNDGGAK